MTGSTTTGPQATAEGEEVDDVAGASPTSPADDHAPDDAVPPDDVELEELDHPPRPTNRALFGAIGVAAAAALAVLLMIGRSELGEADEVLMAQSAAEAAGQLVESPPSNAAALAPDAAAPVPDAAAAPPDTVRSTAPPDVTDGDGTLAAPSAVEPGAPTDSVSNTTDDDGADASADTDAAGGAEADAAGGAEADAAGGADTDAAGGAEADAAGSVDVDAGSGSDAGVAVGDPALLTVPTSVYVEISGDDVILRGPVPDAFTAAALRIQLSGIVGGENVVDATTVDPAAAAPRQPTEVVIRDGLDFGPGDTEITSSTGRRAVATLGQLMEARPDAEVAVAGHTDAEGPAEYNVNVSRRRVTSLLRLLVYQDVWIGDVSRRYVGEAEPIANNITEAGKSLNRRIEVTIDGLFTLPSN